MNSTLLNTNIPQDSLLLHDPWGYTKSIWISNIKHEEHLLVFYYLLTKTIESCIHEEYTNFDAQTTSNCCHGLSVLARGLIILTNQIDLQLIRLESIRVLEDFKNNQNSQNFREFISKVPGPLIDLMSLHTLTYIVEIDPAKGRRTVPRKLKKIANIGTKFCEILIKNLQKKISNIVSESYCHYLEQLQNYPWIGETSISTWGNYATLPYLRTDKKGVKYASCLFSMQISIAYLCHIGATIAVLNDIIDAKTMRCKDRHIVLIRKNKRGQLVPLSTKTTNETKETKIDPIIVFGGYSIPKVSNKNRVSMHNQPWIYQFPSLILACDIHYPQFPNVTYDSNFNNTPITPNENCLKAILKNHAKINGVSMRDPFLFCLSHIFLANHEQVQEIAGKDTLTSLPSCFIPCEAMTNLYL